MDILEARVEPDFEFDLAGRVRNLSLPASPVNALIPLFEAISNALHAVEARWEDQTTSSGKIEIEVHRRDGVEAGSVQGFTVRDNEIGLNDANWRSFRTSDSDFKVNRGGKGVGRLAWLKAFSNCEIVSRFGDPGATMRRAFSFPLRKGKNPIHAHKLVRDETGETCGTTVRLHPFQLNFESHCPKRSTTLAAKLVGHFLTYFAVGKVPTMTLIDGGEIIDLVRYYTDNQQRSEIDILEVSLDPASDPLEFQVYHVLLRKQLKFLEAGLHWLFFAGNERVAEQDAIDGQLGLRYVGEGEDCVYVGLVTGAYLDGHVNQERTGFSFGKAGRRRSTSLPSPRPRRSSGSTSTASARSSWARPTASSAATPSSSSSGKPCRTSWRPICRSTPRARKRSSWCSAGRSCGPSAASTASCARFSARGQTAWTRASRRSPRR